ncbi:MULTISPECIES: hypothetical protein [Pseudomonas]|uniref:Uncharacterized protein n=2 Tax=Pseudomonas TaxID=286 RepID=I3W2K5_PSESX|nr:MULTISPECIES: hypothetical protein [Pseudomonas]AFK89832.1 hypothetical protein [Pseudomonas syringae]KPB78025.1 Uncharacterized protein AC505_2124 [Pseudomonas syringae pv. maculicola]CZT31676.1 hypothetical protein PCPL58_5220 [Pseudomonas cerasi]SOS24403.1 hypothetical protein PL963_05318 [Pseudomonas cerasi]
MAQHAIHEAVVGRIKGDNAQWTLSVRLGDPTARLVPVRSRREPLRIWTSLKVVVKFADKVGITSFSVEL